MLRFIRFFFSVEQTSGLLQSCWMCLDAAGGMLSYTPEKVFQIILACCVQNYIAKAQGVPIHYSQSEPAGKCSRSSSTSSTPSADTTFIMVCNVILHFSFCSLLEICRWILICFCAI